MKRTILLCLVALLSTMLWAQPSQEAELADKYFQDEEFEPALELYLKLNQKAPTEKNVQRIVACYQNLGQLDDALKYLDRSIKKKNSSILFPVMKANLLEQLGEIKESDKLYDDVINKNLRNDFDFIKVGSFLYQNGKLELARKAYLQGRKRAKIPYLFANEIANISMQLGEYENATQEYLNLYYDDFSNQSSANLSILNMVSVQSQDEIEKALLSAVDKRQSDLGLRAMLFEYYVLVENFFEAFVQVKSIDRLFQEDGSRVMNFGETMRNNKDYVLSNKAYDYVIDRKKNSPYLYQAHIEKAVNGELKAFDQIPVDLVSIQSAVADYDALLKEFGYRPQYFNAIYRKANLMVFYLNDLEPALKDLSQLVDQKQFLRLEDWAKAMLLIGDIQLIQQEYNKSKLTYNEVNESFKDRQLGALAKFKLAQLAYYKGEFKLSQALLSAIKDNTSNDISNDAIKLNLLIIDNTGLDSTTTALEIFAQAQLLNYQRLYPEALDRLDSLAFKFPNHELADEILWEKANIYLKQNDINTALTFIDRILNNFKLDIYGDDALFTKARIYDYTLKDQEAAMKHYLEFLTLFPGSLYSVEVRKRIREMRQAG
ncbi:MAG: tetratricopeptide repeat protein [Bacteroidota bacterium]